MRHLWVDSNGIEIAVDMNNNTTKYIKRGTIESFHRGHIATKKSKRYRSAFTTEQVNYLEQEFKKFPYIGNGQRKDVATALNIPERAVKIWFQNRRMKEKKDTGNKEIDDEQAGNRAMEFGKDPLNNGCTVQSNNDQRLNSLPVLSSPINIPSKSNVDEKVEKNKECEPKETKYSKEAFCDQKQMIASPHMFIHPFIKDKVLCDYKKSAEFSIDLCKKYQGDLKKVTYENKQTKQRHNSNWSRKPSRPESSPEDLSSCKKPKLTQPQHKNLESINVHNSGYIPVMPTIYAQPYISPGGVLWKPINMNHIMATSVSSPLTMSSNLSATREGRRSCSCNCHDKTPHPASVTFQQNLHNPNAQYVITAVPFQNASPKF